MAKNAPEKKGKKRILRERTEISVDSATGEVLSETKIVTTVSSDREPGYVKTYFHDDWHKKISKLSPTSFLVLFWLAKAMDYENRVRVGGDDVRLMAKTFGRKRGALLTALWKLVDEKLIVRQKRGLYIVNPDLFAKGKWEDIREIRRELDFIEANNKLG